MFEADSILYCSKQRNGEWEGSVGTYWCGGSMQFKNNPKEASRQYVQFYKPVAQEEDFI